MLEEGVRRQDVRRRFKVSGTKGSRYFFPPL